MFKKNQVVKSIMRKIDKKNTKSLTKSEFMKILNKNKEKKESSNEEDLLDRKLIDSVILENNGQYCNLMNLCQMKGQKWRLIYRASRDGFRAVDFHRNCDDKPNTLTLIKTTTASVLGGFTSQPWSSGERFMRDTVSLIFSLINDQNLTIAFKCTQFEEGIYCNNNMGPCFGKDDLHISNSSNTNNKSRCCVGTSYEDNHGQTFLPAESEYFQTEEIEVFIKDYKPLSNVN
jgi:hypothetical protein